MTEPTQPPRVIRGLRRLRDATKRRPPQRSPGELQPCLDHLRRDDQPRVTTSGRIRAFAVLNPATDILERRLLAFVDCVACVIDHDDYGGIFGARLALLAIVDPSTAAAALDALTGEET